MLKHNENRKQEKQMEMKAKKKTGEKYKIKIEKIRNVKSKTNVPNQNSEK